ncbi:hypothetical protein ACFX19_013649 [Malus domestica]
MWFVVSGKLMLRVKIADNLHPRKSGSRSSESGASSVFEQRFLAKLFVVPDELMLHVESGASLKSGEWCLFDF